MKVLQLNELDKYLYPEGIKNLAEFMQFLKENDDLFIKMRRLDNEGSSTEIFMENDIKEVFINFNAVEMIEEEEVQIVNEIEYFNYLRKLEKRHCKTCDNDGNPNTGCDSLANKKDKLNIEDDMCWLKEEEFAEAFEYEEDIIELRDQLNDIIAKNNKGKNNDH